MLYIDLRLKMIMLIWITRMLFNQINFAQTSGINQPTPIITADVGDNVTLHCFQIENENTEVVIWYKQKIGHEPHVMVTVHHTPTYEKKFKSPRVNIEKEKGGCHLKISDVQPSDEAMYYCGILNYGKAFGKGTFLSVKGKPDLSVSVFQSGGLDSVPAGMLVTLQCSVLSESRAAELQVLWFRAAPPQSHPQIIYTHHNSSHQCESGSSTHTCVYNFSKNILSLNDTGTYYCAVAVCGKIVFGNGTRVQLESSVDPVVIGLAVALGVCVVMIFALTFAATCKSRNHELYRERLDGSVTNKSHNQESDNMELSYAALHFNGRRTKRGRVKKHQSQDIIYSDVQCPPIT
ncbi:uncharacterized protein LOC128532039 [Clarias gariepinus]|uniref:uncharacterized protein LOC128532039 n=1 Tax=Clarias gariepinus TaxID=13013 RepID=UPI00234CBC32|nr:uncharacterized protein LOC128532039 [Clarias gariepinus]